MLRNASVVISGPTREEINNAIRLLQGQGYDVVRREAKLKLAAQAAHPRHHYEREAGLREACRKHAAVELGKSLLARGDVFRHEIVYSDADKAHPFFGMDLAITRTSFEFYHPLGVEWRR